MSTDQHSHATELHGGNQGMQSLVRTLRVLFLLLRVLIVFIFVYLVFSGVFYVREHEEAMLFRFGALQAKGDKEILSRGKLYWAFPYPIDRVERVPAQRSVTITSAQYWPLSNPNRLESTDPGAIPEGDGAVLRPGAGGYLLTGDANIMHMVWAVRYRVANARKYYLRLYHESDKQYAERREEHQGRDRGAEAIIEDILSEAVLAEVATWPVEDVLVLSRAEGNSRERQSLASGVEKRILNLVDSAGVDLGISVDEVNLVEVHPPLATQNAFREVVDAAHDYRAEIATAEAYERRVVPEAEGRASTIRAEAEAYRTRVVESVKAEKAYFETVYAEYEKNPDTMLVALYTDAVRDILSRVETKYVIHARSDGRQEVRLLLGPEPPKPGASYNDQ